MAVTVTGIHQASASQQREGLLSLDFENAPLSQIMESIKEQSRYLFVNKGVDVTRETSIQAIEKTVQEVCELLFVPLNVKYTIEGNTIIISEGPAPVSLSGKVVDASEQPVPGVAVLVKGTTAGTTTDLDGLFSISASPGNILVFSSIGYETQEVAVGNRTTFNIILKDDSIVLESAVAIGYGVVNKRDLSTAISSIKSEDIANQPISDFRQSMAGKMPGVQVMQTSGDPEGSVMVRVRGISSATAGNDPLYIVDGVPMENGLNNLNSNDIESMEVLKDASSAAIYGSRGSNGVILITTKKGLSDNLQVAYDGYYGIEQVSKKIDLMNAYQYAQVSKEAHDAAYLDLNPGGTAPNGDRPESFMNYPVELIPYLNGEPGLTDTDWQDAIFRTASTTSHNISISRSGENVNFFISGNYYYKEGIIINSDFEKYSFRLNLDGKWKKFRYGVNFSPSYSKSNKVNASGSYGSGGIVQSALTSCPIWPVYNSDGTFNFQGNGYWRIGNDYQHNEILNPVALATLQSEVIDRIAMTGRAFIGLDIWKGLSFQTSVGGSFYGAIDNKYRSSELPLLGKDYYLLLIKL